MSLGRVNVGPQPSASGPTFTRPWAIILRCQTWHLMLLSYYCAQHETSSPKLTAGPSDHAAALQGGSAGQNALALTAQSDGKHTSSTSSSSWLLGWVCILTLLLFVVTAMSARRWRQDFCGGGKLILLMGRGRRGSAPASSKENLGWEVQFC